MAASTIHVTGASGSGTSTLGRALADRLGFHFLDSDDFFWAPTTPPYEERRPDDVRNARLLDALRGGDAVLAGSVVDWDAVIEDAFDLVVYLWVPTDVRLARLRRRELAERGTVDEDFLSWAARYDDGALDVRSAALHERWLAARACPVVRIVGELPLEEALRHALAAAR